MLNTYCGKELLIIPSSYTAPIGGPLNKMAKCLGKKAQNTPQIVLYSHWWVKIFEKARRCLRWEACIVLYISTIIYIPFLMIHYSEVTSD